MAENETARDRTNHRERRQIAPSLRRESPIALQEGRIHVLRAVRYEVHHRHQHHEVEKNLPVRDDTAAERTPALVFRTLPHLRFLYTETNVEREQRRQATDEEQRTPSPTWKHDCVRQRREQVATGIPLL